MTLFIILTIVYFIGVGVMAYRLGLPLRWRIGPILVWVVIVGFWPIFLPMSLILEYKHRL